MAWMKWFPWRFVVRRLASAHGFLDPVALIAQLRRFAEPSEVAEPIELLRAGMVFHARGLINSRVIENNLDWVWPYWIERQFNPHDDAFIPRAFSMSHCNFTHRNWTAVGWPDYDALPIVDPRGLLTPLFDGWSLDAWVLSEHGDLLLPSRTSEVNQWLDLEDGVSVVTESRYNTLTLHNRARVYLDDDKPVCGQEFEATCSEKGWLIITLRPCNPEGISFVQQVVLDNERRQWTINGNDLVYFDQPVAQHHAANYRNGDVRFHLLDRDEQIMAECDVGMATAAAMFPIEPRQPLKAVINIPLPDDHQHKPVNWSQALSGCCRLTVPNSHFQFLYDAALRTLVLHSPGEVYPGPYTYHRFWFRDAAFIIQALIYAGLTGRAERAIDGFPDRQRHDGYFHSQNGEWDSNGQALWIMQRYLELTNSGLKPEWQRAIWRGARWITNKRLKHGPNRGLLPPGFSAEHLGPNDCYYWDDFWGIAGLYSAAALCRHQGATEQALELEQEAKEFLDAVNQSLSLAAQRLGRAAMPAAPGRRFDTGAVGSLAAGYPLQLFPANDPRLLDTVDLLLERHSVRNAFFHEIVHSGVNPYLTLHIAQVLLRNGDHRALELMKAVAELASATGQWPEAIHPRTGGGCMGDGQHVWAAAEWLIMQRNCLVREEGERLILGSGIPRAWLSANPAQQPIRFGPCLTRFGAIEIEIAEHNRGSARVSWSGRWYGDAPSIEIRLPGFAHVCAAGNTNTIYVE